MGNVTYKGMLFLAVGMLVFTAPSGWSVDMAALEARAAAQTPPPGSVYREYALHNGGNVDWRVTDPTARKEGAKEFLPNPVLKLKVDDLAHAVRAQVLIDRWGGHAKTARKRIRFNGNAWITLDELKTTPADAAPEKFMSQDNPMADVPLTDLKEGVNTVEGTCGTIEGSAWGQWGLYSVILRVYYDPGSKPHVTGRIASPTQGQTLGENPLIKIEVSDAARVERVDVLALHENYDVNGDGIYREWVRSYHQYPERGAPAAIRNHVGTVAATPFSLTWDTSWVPDQQPGSIQLGARILGKNGLWYATPVVDDLSLGDRPYSVRMYAATEVPPSFSSRLSRPKSCQIVIPPEADLSKAEAVLLHLRTWEGQDTHHRPFQLNGWTHPLEGRNHHFFYNIHEVPVSVPRNGANTFTVCSDTEHHMVEVLWPGPALTVRYAKP